MSIPASPTFAIVTPSHAPDFERCRLLSDSIRRFARINYRHYILVSRRDYPTFKCLADKHTEVLIIEDTLKQDTRLGEGAKEIWQIRGITLITGWVFQQIVKIHAAKHAKEDIVLFADSDTVFVRPFDESSFICDGKVRLFRYGDFYDDAFVPWTRLAHDCLGLPPYQPGTQTVNYISNVVTWIPEHVRAMCERIERISGTSWFEPLVKSGNMSEFILYGTFIEHVLGDSSCHYVDEHSIAHEHWLPEDMDEQTLDSFMKGVRERDIAVMITAKARINPARYAAFLDSIDD